MNTDTSDDSTPAAVPVARHADEANHPDPITGEAGAHPVGVGVGAVGAGIAGAAIGAIAGPLGALVGAAIGVVAGGIAGHEIASSDDEPVSLADRSISTGKAAGTPLPVEGEEPLVGGVSGTVLSSSPVMGIPATSMEEPAKPFHEAFTTTTWQEAAAEDRIAGKEDPAEDILPEVEAPTAEAGATAQGITAGETFNSEEIIRPAAYFRYLHRQATGEPGDALGDWVSAEHEVLAP